MGKLAVTVISLVCFINATLAQAQVLIVQGVSPDLYIIHKTAAKENYYSIGRIYNVAPKEIAAYNNLAFESGLHIGQAIKIPLTQSNFIQTNDAGNKLLKPVYHIVGAKEGLYRVSVNYNKVPLDELKKWNKLSSDAVSNGTKLIVGYLNNQGESPVVKNDVSPKDVAVDQPVTKKTMDVPKEITPDVKKPDAVAAGNTETNTTTATKDPGTGSKNILVAHSAINFNGGVFKKLYDDQSSGKLPVAESGVSGVFKSTSGWRDGKYYCFHNTAPAGTILKITNTINGKSVYAKVLDLIPDINQNAGLILHLSNSAAEELGVSSTKFDCSITYSK